MSDPADYEHEFHDRYDPTCVDSSPFDMPLETLVGACKVCHPPRRVARKPHRQITGDEPCCVCQGRGCPDPEGCA